MQEPILPDFKKVGSYSRVSTVFRKRPNKSVQPNNLNKPNKEIKLLESYIGTITKAQARRQDFHETNQT